MAPHLNRLGAATLTDYLNKLRGQYRPFVVPGGNPDWEFVRVSKARTPYGIYVSFS